MKTLLLDIAMEGEGRLQRSAAGCGVAERGRRRELLQHARAGLGAWTGATNARESNDSGFRRRVPCAWLVRGALPAALGRWLGVASFARNGCSPLLPALRSPQAL